MTKNNIAFAVNYLKLTKKSYYFWAIPQSPGGSIPVLEIDGVLYSDSNAIARYIARKYGK